jgi:hypothetical protein
VNTGRNLLPNNGFEVKTTASTAAPDGWTLKGGATSTYSIITTAQKTLGSSKRALRLQNAVANDGIQCQVKGLKASTKYLIGFSYVRTAGTVSWSTTGGLGAGNDYQNFSTSDSSTSTLQNAQFVVKTDTNGSDITVSFFISSGAGGDVALYAAWMYEMNDANQGELPLLPTQSALYTTADDTVTNAGAGAWSNRSALTINQYVPFWGYRFRYQVTACFKAETIGGSGQNYEYAFRLRQDINSSGSPTTVEGPASGEFPGGTVTLEYVIDNPTPGSTYNFTFDVYTQGTGTAADTIIFNPTVATGLATQSRARLIVERM